MKDKDGADNKDGEEGVVAKWLKGEVELGDLIWVRLDGSSWWPAQVVDADGVSDTVKPNNRAVGEVLVRLYGSYDYLYVDPVKSLLEFEHVLEQNNGSYKEIFRKALERDLPCTKSGRSKGKGFRSEELTQKGMKKIRPGNRSAEANGKCGMTTELNTRRMKVMQNLGLVAPPGSPFKKDPHP